MSKENGPKKKDAGGRSSRKRAKFSIPVGRSLAKAFEITGHRAITPAGQLYEVESLKGKGPGVLMVFDDNVSVVFKKDVLPKHPNIVPAMASVSKDGVPRYVVTAPPQGESLAKVVDRKGPMHPGPAASATLQLLSALNAIHTKSCHHGNLNPESVTLFTSEGGEMEISLMHHGSVSFKSLPEDPSFLSPEQVLGEGNVDARSDLWSVGVLLYYLVYGRLPFVGGDKDEISGKILLKDPGFPGDERIPEELRAIVRKSLEKDPGDRYENVTVMVGDLLSLHEKYDEAMSELVRDALRKSVPPPPTKEAMRMPVPAPVVKTASAPKTPEKKEARAVARPAIQAPASNKTMLGIPSPVAAKKKPEPKPAPKPAPEPKSAPKPEIEGEERVTLPTPPDSSDLAAAANSSWDLHEDRPTTPVDEAELEQLKRKVKPLPAPLPNLAPKLKKEPAPKPKPAPKPEPKPAPKPEPKPAPKPEPEKVQAPPPLPVISQVLMEAPVAAAEPEASPESGEPSGYAMLADSLEDTNDIETNELPLGPTWKAGGTPRRKLLLLGAGVVFLLAAIVVLILVLSGGGEDRGGEEAEAKKPEGTQEVVVEQQEAEETAKPAAVEEAPSVQEAPVVEEAAVVEETPEAEEAPEAEEPAEAEEPIESTSGGGSKKSKHSSGGGHKVESAPEEAPETEQPKKTKPRRKKEGAWASNPFGG